MVRAGMNMAMPHRLDVTGLRCPLPVLRAGRALRDLAPGDELLVLATDPMAELDMRHFCATGGHDFLGCATADGVLSLRIRRGAVPEDSAA